jgi:hypothetical protein
MNRSDVTHELHQLGDLVKSLQSQYTRYQVDYLRFHVVIKCDWLRGVFFSKKQLFTIVIVLKEK